MRQNASFLPADADQVVISVNHKAGTRSARTRVDRLVELLGQAGFRAETFTDLAGAADRANQSHAEGRLRALVGAGGDGTAAELVNRTAEGVPLCMLPSGNENLLARYLELGPTPHRVCQTIADGALLRMDAGRAAQRIFLLMIGCGLDADVCRRVQESRKGHFGSRNYVKPILESIRTYKYPELRVCWDEVESAAGTPRPGGSSRAAVRWLFAFNLPCYGGGLRLMPQADATDGLLDVCTFRRGSLGHGLLYAGAVFLGRHQTMADCTTRRVRRLRITAEEKVPYQLDGDPGGFLPVDVEVLPGRLTLVVPASRTEQLQRKEIAN